jgi:hypothetical protein
MLEAYDVDAWNLELHAHSRAFHGNVQRSSPVLMRTHLTALRRCRRGDNAEQQDQ